jgi:hypothetical protein
VGKGGKKGARAAFVELLGRPQRERDLPWDRTSIISRPRARPEIHASRRGRVSAKGATGASCRSGGISVIAGTHSACACSTAGKPPNANNDGGAGPKCASSGPPRRNSGEQKGARQVARPRVLGMRNRPLSPTRGHAGGRIRLLSAIVQVAMSPSACLTAVRRGTAATLVAKPSGGCVIENVSACAA